MPTDEDAMNPPGSRRGPAPARGRLPRRGFVMSGLIAGFTLATTRLEAQAINTDTHGLAAGDALIPVADGRVPAYYARPEHGAPFPTVLVIEEIFGVHEWLKDICRRLAKAGYLAVAPELYARIADLSLLKDVQQILRDVIAKAPDATMLSDLDAAAAWAADNGGDPERLGVMGFCRGGRDTWLYAAHNPKLKVAVAWYGPVAGPTSAIQPHTPLELAGALKCPLLGLYGGKDASIRPDDVQAAAAKARAAGQTVEIVYYPDAPHGFAADYRPSYRADDAASGWQRALDWFKGHNLA
jgi:carboxymethylenebutenolidase